MGKEDLPIILFGSPLVAGDHVALAGVGRPFEATDDKGLEKLGLCLRQEVVDGHDVRR